MIDRNINVEKLTQEQLENAINQVSKQIQEEVDATCSKVNKLLNRYGLECRMEIAIEEIDKQDS